jgi:alpha-beta hydrolase superfamily lysophospholipase
MSVTDTDHTSDPSGAIDPALRGETRQLVSWDGAALNYRFWPAEQPRDAVVYLHGIAGHSLWFSSTASRLAGLGISVYGQDRRGSGLNMGLEPGHLAHHEIMLRDIRRFVELARSEHPGGKVFLVAGCWGAKPGVVFAARAQQLLDGLVLEAPALSVRVKLPPRDLLGVAASLLVSPRRRFDIPLRPDQYTESPRMRAFIAADPLRLLKVTSRFYLETARLDRLAAAAPPAIHLPVLLLQGGRDVIVDVAGIRGWFDRLASADKTLKVYPEIHHILEFEAQQNAYLADLIAWLRGHGAGHPDVAGALSEAG